MSWQVQKKEHYKNKIIINNIKKNIKIKKKQKKNKKK